MELVMFVIAVIALGILGIRHGYDSRDRLRSKEEELAAYGVTREDRLPDWVDAVPPWPLDDVFCDMSQEDEPVDDRISGRVAAFRSWDAR